MTMFDEEATRTGLRLKKKKRALNPSVLLRK
jgi:hypothetical protein